MLQQRAVVLRNEQHGNGLAGARLFTMCGPLIDPGAVATYRNAIEEIRAGGGEILCGGKVIDRPGN